jgi:hypothetical protein
MLQVIGAPTLDQELRSRGYGHRDSDGAPSARTIYRISDGEVVGQMKAHEAWEWLKAGCPRTSSAKETKA